MVVLTYRLELLEPILITGLKGDPNSAVGLDHVPGSSVRGAVVARYARSKGIPVDPADQHQRELFFDGSTRFLNAYPVDSWGLRTLPVPLSCRQPKYTAAGGARHVYDFAIQERKDQDYRSVGEAFCSLVGSSVELVEPDRWLAVHTYRARRFGRPVDRRKASLASAEDPGTLFRYESLAAGQTLCGVILCPDEQVANELKDLLEKGPLRLGAARTAGYGRARMAAVSILEGDAWRETETRCPRSAGESPPATSDDPEPLESETFSEQRHAQDGEEVIVTLLSDAIIRDDRGQVAPTVEALGGALGAMAGGTWTPRRHRCFFRPIVVGGFNRKWGLPLPQAWALEKGSVFTFQVSGTYDATALEREGIGERRLDGFGRVALNWQRREVIPVRAGIKHAGSSARIQDPFATSVAKRMLEHIVRSRLDGIVLKRAQEYKSYMKGMPTPTQLSRLRLLIRRQLSSSVPSLDKVRQSLEDVKDRQTAWKQFQRARIGERGLLEWLRSALEAARTENGFRSLLGIQERDLPKLGEQEAELGKALREEYVLRYVDAVLAIAVKKQKQNEGF